MTETTTKDETKDIKNKEGMRLYLALMKAKGTMVGEYAASIKRTGGLLTTSMTYAYEKGLNDFLKLLAKETSNEKSLQKQEN